ncbi:MAG: hypothetical protein PHC85_00580 [Candidatus Pacebacteria bacterium]|nr:hypothetical protein [Candidatus Paceibacterota bacterium]
MILLITLKSDLHTELVEYHLKNASAPYFRFNTDAIFDDYKITLGVKGKEFFGSIRSVNEGTVLDTREVKAVWYRRTRINPPPSCAVNRDLFIYSAAEYAGFLKNLWITLNNAKWMDKPRIVHFLQEHRLAQYKLALEVGLKVPTTHYTNDGEVLIQNLDFSKKVALKPISSNTIVRPEENGEKTGKIILTNILEKEDFSKEQFLLSVGNTPVQFQDYIEKQTEVRVTVVDSQLFPCEIDSQAVERMKVDYRRFDFSKETHRPCKLDSDIEEKIRIFMNKNKLVFGAIDLIKEPNGDFTFLEINPAGQWQWIEVLTGLPISKAIAEWLIRNS